MTTAMFKVKLCPGGKSYTRYSGFSKDLVEALILSEDGSFFAHKGFDWYEIKESFKQNWKEGRIARGGSTITQQLAKNLYLSKDKTIARKIKEYFIAHQLESVYKKPEILERYLNIVEFGPKLYGASKASWHYFQKAPSQLSFLESVYLVSLLPSPVRLSRGFAPRKLTSGNIFRMKIILRRFYRYRKMSQELYEHYLNLVENEDWPFGNTFENIPSVFNELEEEIDDLPENDDSDMVDPDDNSELDTDPNPRETTENPRVLEDGEDSPYRETEENSPSTNGDDTESLPENREENPPSVETQPPPSAEETSDPESQDDEDTPNPPTEDFI